jgi:aminopeptidase N
MNIGDYQKLSAVEDSLVLNFYYLPYNLVHAQKLFEDFKSMTVHANRLMGPYPFTRDGFTILEAPYPMEHQGAVSIGSINEPLYSSKVNYENLVSMIWHEGGHEWWGNNVSMSDNAEIWFHEAFTTYFEWMNVEISLGKKEALKKVFNDLPSNKEKMLGEYGVNHFKLSSVYSKGALMVHTLRNVLANDSVFFGLWKGIQRDFAYRTVNTDSIVDYVCRYTGLPLSPFFSQYLRYAALPKLEILRIEKSSKFRYRWKADAADFILPVNLILPGDKSIILNATDKWQEIEIKNVKLSQIKLDKDHYYAEMVMIK